MTVQYRRRNGHNYALIRRANGTFVWSTHNFSGMLPLLSFAADVIRRIQDGEL